MDKKMEKGIGSRLRTLRKSKGKKQKIVASELNVTALTLSRMENSLRYPTPELMIELSRQYDCDLHWLLTGEGTMIRGNESVDSATNVKLPLFQKLSKTLIKSSEDDVAGILSLPDVPANAVACKSKDDGCSPRINSGDTVIFEPGDCDAGDLAVVCDQWGNGLIRNMQMQGDKVLYVADNKGYEHLGDDDVSCLGKVLGTIRMFSNT